MRDAGVPLILSPKSLCLLCLVVCGEVAESLKAAGSPYLWIKYYQHGRPVRESNGTKNETVARRMLRAREGDVERGIPIDPKVGRVTFHEAAEDMLNDYKANPQAHLRRCEAADRQAPRAVLRQQAAVVAHGERHRCVRREASR